MRRQGLDWLGLTPEPERELPGAVAVLRGSPVDAERRRVHDLVLYGYQRDWLRYLGDVVNLVGKAVDGPPPMRSAARHAAAIVLEHHRMLIGMPGPGYDITAAQRAHLAEALRKLCPEPS